MNRAGNRRFRLSLLVLGVTSGLAFIAPTAQAQDAQTLAVARLQIEPEATELVGRRDQAQLILTVQNKAGAVQDATRHAVWSSLDSGIATVDPNGRVHPLADGTTTVVARLGGYEATASVEVRGVLQPRPIEFEHEVLPSLTKAGCNQGACHGTPTGKNGFRLSLRGYDPTLDFQTLAREVGSRRTNPIEPEASLVLQKGSGAIPHAGGKRFSPDRPTYQNLRAWIAEGLRPQPEDSPRPLRLNVWPTDRVLDEPSIDQQVVVRATFSDGSVRDVTRLARYSLSDEAKVTVDDDGLVCKRERGEVTILISFESLIATSRLVFREEVPGFVWSNPPENNFIDRHIFRKLELLRIPPSPLSEDATFCRRVYLDVLGIPPTPEELISFLDDPAQDKRSRLIDRLLDRPEYVDFWALKWSDRLGCNQRFTGFKGAYSYHRWIRDQVAANTPFDQFARAILTASGSNYTTPPASFYRRLRSPEDAVESVSQLFLGVRVQCAKCHNHPAERWTQDDYYGMAAFFSQLRFKNGPQYFAQYNKEETVYLDFNGRVVQPRTGYVMKPKPLGSPAPEIGAGEDRREALAVWVTSPENPFFARAAVNRIWYHLFGRGIVEPVDDLRDSNPPASGELLAALAQDFIESGYDIKHTIQLILNSRTYQLSSETLPLNASDERYFSHAKVRLLSAEQLLDAASIACGASEQLFHLPPGTRAAEIPDGEFNHPFLRTFGQPPRSVACECERGTDSTLEQALQLIGGKTLHEKLIASDNRIGKLIEAGADDDRTVEQLFLATLGRLPDEHERTLSVGRLQGTSGDSRRRAAEDLLWSLLNHPEFLFQH